MLVGFYSVVVTITMYFNRNKANDTCKLIMLEVTELYMIKPRILQNYYIILITLMQPLEK